MISGMSERQLSALKTFEDLGYYCVEIFWLVYRELR